MTTRADLQRALANRNVQAFYRAVRQGESRQDDLAYRMRFGGLGQAPKYFDSFADHPRIFEPTTGGRKSSAAGAPQVTATTWDEERRKYGWPDFSPPCQDELFVARLIYRKALDAVIAGEFERACFLCGNEWTSLPGGPEENAATARARETYIRWGGLFEPAEASSGTKPAIPETKPAETGSPAAQDDAGAAIDASPAPSPQPIPTEQPMGFLAALLPSLFKAAPDLIRLLGSGSAMTERYAAVAQQVFEVAKNVTGSMNEQEAVQRIQADPAAAAAFKAAVAENFDQWLGMMVKFAELDEASRGKAREFVASYGREPVFFRFTFVEVLSVFMLVIAAVGGGFVLWDPKDQFTSEMQTAVVMLMLIGGWNGVKEFWLGSSMGSMRKDQTINQQSKG